MNKKEKLWMFWLLGMIILGMLTSCKTKYVAVPEYHTEYVYHSDTLHHRDSIYMKDSIYVEKEGDTVSIYKTRYIYIDQWRDRVVYRDSIKVDSIRVPYPVEKELSFWQKSIIRLWPLGLVGLIGLVGIFVIVCHRVRKWLLARSVV